MSDTNLTQLIVNHLTRDELHNADFTDHGNELFVQKDHAGVSVGGVGVDALDTTNITNCITNIPQDINLELSNGTLTLKAGSKVYVPNGAGVFDTVTIANDITLSGASTLPNAVRMLYYNNGNIAVFAANLSGTTPPPSGTNQMFYNTSDNTIKRYTNGSVVASGYSLPIATIIDDGTYLCGSIDQVFNGIGYIGSHVFFLPGYSVLTPNGRNADGTLANRKYTFTSCTVYTRNLTGSSIPLFVKYDGTIVFSTGISYDPYTNTTPINPGCAQVATATLTGGVISNFVPKQPFHAVDYSDSDYIANCAMPSDNYITLTLGASGTSYTAPADGFVSLSAKTSGTDYQMLIITDVYGVSIRSDSLNNRLLLPVRKGKIFYVSYDGSLSDVTFRFVYAQGAK